MTNLVFSQNILNFALSKYTLHINILKKKQNNMQNFQITSQEDGKKYWISRSIATRSEVVVVDDDNVYLLINKRGKGTPDFQGCWNITCGYLEYDVTLEENATKELLEETGIYIPSNEWQLVGIDSCPKTANRQNVTIAYRTIISMEFYDSCKRMGSKMACNGGEENEVSDVWLMPLTPDNIESIDWAFNHKVVAREIFNDTRYANFL